MKIIDFPYQSGEDWLKWRRSGIGASDIGVITGSNSYKTPLKLWEIKCGYKEEDPMNAAMQHGKDKEIIARQWINEHFQLHLMPLCVEDPEKPHFRASLDGYDFDQDILCEIKCPVSESVLEKALLSQSIPDYWFDQIQWQIMLSNPKRAFIAIWDYRTNSCITLDMFGHGKKIEKMRDLADKFWHSVRVGTPPAPRDGDFRWIEDEELRVKLEEYGEITKKESGLKKRKAELKTQIEEYARDGNIKAYGYKVQKVASPSRYDMEQMRLDGIDVDAYLKKGEDKGSFRITQSKR